MTYPCSSCNRDEGSPICTTLCGRQKITWPPRPPAPEEALRPAFERSFMAYYTNGAHLLERFDTGHYRSQEAQAAWRIAIEFRNRTTPLTLETAEEARKDRAHAEAYYRQAEKLLTSNEATLHAEIERLTGLLGEALMCATDHLNFQALERSHCNSMARIRQGLAAYAQASGNLTASRRAAA